MGSEIDRFANIRLRLIRSPFFGYALAVLTLALAVAITLGIAQYTRPGPAIGMLYLIAIFAAAWMGYGPGFFACIVTFVVLPYLFTSGFTFSRIDFGRFGLILIGSVLVSSIAAGRRRVERRLREANEELGNRVQRRTTDIERANSTLAENQEDLRQARQRLANILDSITEAFLALDRNWCFLYANQAIAAAAGLSQNEIIGRNLWDLFPQAKETEFHTQYSRVMEERVAVQFEVCYPPDGGQWLEVRAHPTEEGLSAYIVNVTGRHKIQEKLSAGHRQLVDVLESISDAFYAVDRRWHFTYLNHRGARLIRRPAEQALGHTIWDLFPDLLGSHVERELRRAMDDRVPVQFEAYYAPFQTWVELHVHPTPDGLALFARDISDRKKAEVSLSLLGGIIESSEDAIISKDLDAVIASWNGGAEQVYGYTAAEAIGRSMTIILPEERAGEERDILDRLRAGERVEHFETTRLRKDGRTIHVSLTISPIRDSSGAIIGASHIARDITDRKRFEEQFRQTAKLESLGVLAGGVAHDFNNLLTGIMGNASLALDNAPAYSPNRVMIEEILKASESAANLTRQLLAYAGKGRFIVQLVNLSALISEISNLIRTSIPKSVQVRLDLADGLPPVEADAGQMQQIVMNLVINAAEAIGDKAGTVLIQTGVQEVDEQYMATLTDASGELKPGRYVNIEVHDTGCGMDDATKARIFDPFFTTKFTGRGLGLSAAMGIVRGHRGALKVYSKPGQGSTFKLLFPAAATAATQHAPARQAAGDLKGSGVVLVIDDERVVRTTAKLTLERHGYTVLVAEHGLEAIQIFQKHAEIQVVLLDLTMPIMSGEETARSLRTVNPEVRIILSSGFNEVEAVQRFTGKGLAGFIQKPYTAAALAEMVKSVMSDGHARA